MRRLLRGAAVVLGVTCAAAGLVACGGGGGDGAAGIVRFEFTGSAASVGGVGVPASELRTLIDGFRKAPGALQLAIGSDTLNQAGSDQPMPAVVATLLQSLIYEQVVTAELARRGVTVPESDRAIAETQTSAVFGTSLDAAPDLRTHLVDSYAAYVTLDKLLTPPPPDEATLRAVYDADLTAWDQTCVRHILVKERAAADTLAAELRGGADFATLARERSIDTASGTAGGDLGCTQRGLFVEPFETAAWTGAVGVLQGPIESQFGWHVLEVTKRGTLTFEEAREQLLQLSTLEPFTALGGWLNENVPKLAVTIDPRFGSWDPDGLEVIPVGAKASGLEITPDSSSTTGAVGPSTTR